MAGERVGVACPYPGNQVTGSKSTRFLRGAVQAWLRRSLWMTNEAVEDTSSQLTDNLGPLS